MRASFSVRVTLWLFLLHLAADLLWKQPSHYSNKRAWLFGLSWLFLLLSDIKVLNSDLKQTISWKNTRQAASGGLTGIEIHGSDLQGVIAGVRIAAVFAIIVHHKHTKQDDGNNLQSQGQYWELQPHVGGVGRHLRLVLVISGRLTLTHTHTHARTLTLPFMSFLKSYAV